MSKNANLILKLQRYTQQMITRQMLPISDDSNNHTQQMVTLNIIIK